jgi:adenosylcobinamide-phosphate synthase
VTFVSVLIALILEQFRPLPYLNPVYAGAAALVRGAERNFNAGEHRHGIVAWCAVVLGCGVVIGLGEWGCAVVAMPLALVFDVGVLYLTLGFRQFSHPYTEIQVALEGGNLPRAREVLSDWMRETQPDFTAERLTAPEVARHAIERALVLAHRHVFGVFFWYVILGPGGAVAYRMADFAARTWSREAIGPFANFANSAFRIIDWIPSRMTAIGFAIVGNFEDAMYAWRNFAARWSDPLAGVLLSAGGGALGVRLGGGTDTPIQQVELPVAGSEFDTQPTFDQPPGIEVDPGHMRSAVGMVWRAMVLWLILLLLLSIAHWIA